MKRILKMFVLILFLAAIGIQFVRPNRTNPAVVENETLEVSTKVPENVSQLLSRSCMDCHSNVTRYPWYSNVAPISWSVVDHVRVGRDDLNFSVWDTYSDSKKSRKLKEICEEVEEREMPFYQYLWIHWDARLSDADVKLLCDWTKLEMKRLATKESES